MLKRFLKGFLAGAMAYTAFYLALSLFAVSGLLAMISCITIMSFGILILYHSMC